MRTSPSDPGARPVLFVSHEASRTGAPIALLNLLRWLKKNTDLPLRVVLLQEGQLAADFAAVAPTVTLTQIGIGRSRLLRKVGRIPLLGEWLKSLWHQVVTPRAVEQQPALVYANTVGTARLIRKLSPPGVPVLVHVHEMERAIQVAAGPEGMDVLKSVAQRYVASTTPVKKNLVKNHGIEPSQIELLPNFIVIDELLVQSAEQYRARMRQQLGIPQDAIVIGGCGGTDERKGVDLFVEMARSVRDRMSDGAVHFVWVGQVFEDTFTHGVIERVREWKLEKVFHFTGAHPKPPELFCGFDVFVLSSREEPMGLVALEAASVGKPIVCFAGAGGMADFVADECGIVVEPVAGEPLARAVLQMASDPGMMSSFGSRAYCKVRATHDIELVAPRFAKLIQEMSGCREQAHDTGARVNCLIGV